MKRKVIITIVIAILILFGLTAIFLSGSFLGAYLQYRNHWSVGVAEAEFTESGKELRNPNRGFYSLFGFVIREDAPDGYYSQQLGTKMSEDDNALSLIHINLI